MKLTLYTTKGMDPEAQSSTEIPVTEEAAEDRP